MTPHTPANVPVQDKMLSHFMEELPFPFFLYVKNIIEKTGAEDRKAALTELTHACEHLVDLTTATAVAQLLATTQNHKNCEEIEREVFAELSEGKGKSAVAQPRTLLQAYSDKLKGRSLGKKVLFLTNSLPKIIRAFQDNSLITNTPLFLQSVLDLGGLGDPAFLPIRNKLAHEEFGSIDSAKYMEYTRSILTDIPVYFSCWFSNSIAWLDQGTRSSSFLKFPKKHRDDLQIKLDKKYSAKLEELTNVIELSAKDQNQPGPVLPSGVHHCFLVEERSSETRIWQLSPFIMLARFAEGPITQDYAYLHIKESTVKNRVPAVTGSLSAKQANMSLPYNCLQSLLSNAPEETTTKLVTQPSSRPRGNELESQLKKLRFSFEDPSGIPWEAELRGIPKDPAAFVLGARGTSVVVRARVRSSSVGGPKLCVIKILKPVSVWADRFAPGIKFDEKKYIEGIARRFRHEIAAMEDLTRSDAQGVAEFLGHGTIEPKKGVKVSDEEQAWIGQPFIVRRYYESSLARFIDNRPPWWDEQNDIYITKQILEAVYGIERAALSLLSVYRTTEAQRGNSVTHWLHRDIRPENLLYQGQGLMVVCDLGSSYHIKDGEDAPGMNVRTLWENEFFASLYSAPEIWKTPEGFHPKCDVFSLGIVLNELLWGKSSLRNPLEGWTPPPKNTYSAAVMARLNKEYLAPNKISLREIVNSALKDDPSERSDMESFYLALAQIGRALRTFLRDECIKAGKRGMVSNSTPEVIRDSLNVFGSILGVTGEQALEYDALVLVRCEACLDSHRVETSLKDRIIVLKQQTPCSRSQDLITWTDSLTEITDSIEMGRVSTETEHEPSDEDAALEQEALEAHRSVVGTSIARNAIQILNQSLNSCQGLVDLVEPKEGYPAHQAFRFQVGRLYNLIDETTIVVDAAQPAKQTVRSENSMTGNKLEEWLRLLRWFGNYSSKKLAAMKNGEKMDLMTICWYSEAMFIPIGYFSATFDYFHPDAVSRHQSLLDDFIASRMSPERKRAIADPARAAFPHLERALGFGARLGDLAPWSQIELFDLWAWRVATFLDLEDILFIRGDDFGDPSGEETKLRERLLREFAQAVGELTAHEELIKGGFGGLFVNPDLSSATKDILSGTGVDGREIKDQLLNFGWNPKDLENNLLDHPFILETTTESTRSVLTAAVVGMDVYRKMEKAGGNIQKAFRNLKFLTNLLLADRCVEGHLVRAEKLTAGGNVEEKHVDGLIHLIGILAFAFGARTDEFGSEERDNRILSTVFQCIEAIMAPVSNPKSEIHNITTSFIATTEFPSLFDGAGIPIDSYDLKESLGEDEKFSFVVSLPLVVRALGHIAGRLQRDEVSIDQAARARVFTLGTDLCDLMLDTRFGIVQTSPDDETAWGMWQGEPFAEMNAALVDALSLWVGVLLAERPEPLVSNDLAKSIGLKILEAIHLGQSPTIAVATPSATAVSSFPLLLAAGAFFPIASVDFDWTTEGVEREYKGKSLLVGPSLEKLVIIAAVCMRALVQNGITAEDGRLIKAVSNGASVLLRDGKIDTSAAVQEAIGCFVQCGLRVYEESK